MRAPALADVVLALLLGAILLLVGSWSSPALAHAGHHHPTAAPALGAVPPAALRQPAPVEAPARPPLGSPHGAKAPQAPLDLLPPETCCCSSLACHAGVMAPPFCLSDPYRPGERLGDASTVACVGAAQDGIERPPRVRGGV